MKGILHVVWRFYLSGLRKHCGAWAEVVSGLGLYLILWAFLNGGWPSRLKEMSVCVTR